MARDAAERVLQQHVVEGEDRKCCCWFALCHMQQRRSLMPPVLLSNACSFGRAQLIIAEAPRQSQTHLLQCGFPHLAATVLTQAESSCLMTQELPQRALTPPLLPRRRRG